MMHDSRKVSAGVNEHTDTSGQLVKVYASTNKRAATGTANTTRTQP
jgi:hypothetical protein